MFTAMGGGYTKIVITMTIAMAHCDTMKNCNITHPKHSYDGQL
jgi:hypothetical protein